jgi:hypothetical protein
VEIETTVNGSKHQQAVCQVLEFGAEISLDLQATHRRSALVHISNELQFTTDSFTCPACSSFLSCPEPYRNGFQSSHPAANQTFNSLKWSNRALAESMSEFETGI